MVLKAKINTQNIITTQNKNVITNKHVLNFNKVKVNVPLQKLNCNSFFITYKTYNECVSE